MACDVGELPGESYREREGRLGRAEERIEEELRMEAFIEWILREKPEWFVTFTFGEVLTRRGKMVRPTYEWAKLRLAVALNELQLVIFGKRYRRRRYGFVGIIAWEEHADGAPHAHAIFWNVGDHSFKDLNDFFIDRTGIARWYPFPEDTKQRRKMAAYTVKYMFKAKGRDRWEIYGTLSTADEKGTFAAG